MLAIVKDVCESYHNVKILLDLLGIEQLDYINVFDLKLTNIYIGIGKHSSTFPCPWCELSMAAEFDSQEFMYSGVLEGLLVQLGCRQNSIRSCCTSQGKK